MARMNPLGKIKDITVASLKVPVSAAGSAVGLAKATTGRAADAVTSLVGSDAEPSTFTREASRPDRPAAKKPTAKKPPTPTDEPVNVIDELGLDPAPVTKPKPARKPAGKKPVTKIDAAADPSHVDVTPADMAKAVHKE